MPIATTATSTNLGVYHAWWMGGGSATATAALTIPLATAVLMTMTSSTPPAPVPVQAVYNDNNVGGGAGGGNTGGGTNDSMPDWLVRRVKFGMIVLATLVLLVVDEIITAVVIAIGSKPQPNPVPVPYNAITSTLSTAIVTGVPSTEAMGTTVGTVATSVSTGDLDGGCLEAVREFLRATTNRILQVSPCHVVVVVGGADSDAKDTGDVTLINDDNDDEDDVSCEFECKIMAKKKVGRGNIGRYMIYGDFYCGDT